MKSKKKSRVLNPITSKMLGEVADEMNMLKKDVDLIYHNYFWFIVTEINNAVDRSYEGLPSIRIPYLGTLAPSKKKLDYIKKHTGCSQ